MIVEAATRTRSQLEQLANLQLAKSETENVQATLHLLEKLRPDVESVTRLYLLIRDRLSVSDRHSISLQFGQVLRLVQTSHQALRSEPRQVAQLTNIGSSLNNLRTLLTGAWKVYATAQLAPLLHTLRLVQSLPELRPRATEIAALQQQLQTLSETLPDEARLARFDEGLRALSVVLSTLQGLSPTIQAFLQRVADGSATLADLNDEVLEWCRQGGRERAFRIIFSS